MNVLDLFSGIGGFSIGLERVGFKTVALCEINPFCRADLKKHWPQFHALTMCVPSQLKRLPPMASVQLTRRTPLPAVLCGREAQRPGGSPSPLA
ncbi:DNA cytosine methyltransferase [Rhizobium laguerreae]|uniref:DNA cytosine methyltransferase n=1 Tax=Rhizobium laguerreae TaxID=1076926 RepID=UPI001C9029CF